MKKNITPTLILISFLSLTALIRSDHLKCSSSWCAHDETCCYNKKKSHYNCLAIEDGACCEAESPTACEDGFVCEEAEHDEWECRREISTVGLVLGIVFGIMFCGMIIAGAVYWARNRKILQARNSNQYRDPRDRDDRELVDMHHD